MTCMKAWMSLKFGQIPSTPELSALEHLKNYLSNVMNTLAPSFVIGCSSFLQITRISITFKDGIIP